LGWRSSGYNRRVAKRHTLTDKSDTATDGWASVTLTGELDLASADRLRDVLEEAADTGVRIISVDARQVTLLDSTSLGVLLFFARLLRDRGGHLELVYATPSVRRTLEVTALGRAMKLVERPADAP
jgi:anti-anti-sigma factor